MSGSVIPVVFGIKILHLESKRVYVGFQTVAQYSDFTWLLIYTQLLVDLSSEILRNVQKIGFSYGISVIV